jgi:hypothetical protein
MLEHIPKFLTLASFNTRENRTVQTTFKNPGQYLKHHRMGGGGGGPQADVTKIGADRLV